jgi:hypothetical protein
MIHRELLILTAIPVIVLLLSVISTVVSISDSILHSAFAQNETSTGTSPVDYRVYDNSTLGIKIEVPSDWLYNASNDTHVTFLIPKQFAGNASNGYVADLVVEVGNVSNSMSLDTLFKRGIEELQSFPFFHLITSNSTVLAGNPAHEIVYTTPIKGVVPSKGLEIMTLKNGKSYVISCIVVPEDKFDILLPILRHMIDSFQITK